MARFTGHILMLFGPVTTLIRIRKTSIQTQKPNAQIQTMRARRRISRKKLIMTTHLLTLRLLLAGGHRKISPR
jgi:hypothetical protein